MKNILTISLLLTFGVCFGQNLVLNGNFENTTGTCEINTTNTSFNGFMSNCYSFGSDNIDILTEACGYGKAQNGNFFIAICCHIPVALEAFGLKLSSPLIIGQSYTLSFWNRKPVGWNASKLKVGYSIDSLSFGTLIDTISIPDTTWSYESLTFSPTDNSSFITVAVTDTFGSWNHIDNFTLSNTTGINPLDSFQSIISIFPNPFSNQLTFSLADNEQTTVVSLYNFLGQQVLQQAFTNSTTINTEQLADGIYFYELRNSNGSLRAGKLAKQ